MPAIRRTITRNHVQQVPQRPAPANAPVAPQLQRNAQATPQEEAVEALPSLEDTLIRIEDKAEELEELAMASLRFDEGTSISNRVRVACTWRGVDPEEPYLFVQKYSFAEGDEGLCCAVCTWAYSGRFQTFSVTNDRVHKRHPLNDTHLQALGLFLRVDWKTLQNKLKCPYCDHEVVGERHDQMTTHINEEHPEHAVPNGRRKKRHLLQGGLLNAPVNAPAPTAVTPALSPLHTLPIPAPFAGATATALPALHTLPRPPPPQRSVPTVSFVPPRVGQQVAAANSTAPQLATAAQRSDVQRTQGLPTNRALPPAAATPFRPMYIMALDATGQWCLLPWPYQLVPPVPRQQLRPILPALPQQLRPILPTLPQQLQPALHVPRLYHGSLNGVATVPPNQATPASGQTAVDQMLAEWASPAGHIPLPSSSTANNQDRLREGPSLTTMSQLRNSLTPLYDNTPRPIATYPTSDTRTALSDGPSVSRNAAPTTRTA